MKQFEKTGRHKGLSLAIIVLAMGVISCSGIPDHLKQQAKEFPQRFDDTNAKIDELESTFNGQKSSDEYTSFFQKYAEREDWQSNFRSARARLSDGAEKVYEDQIKPLLKSDKPEDADQIQQQIDRANLALRETLDLANYPANRMVFLQTARDEASAWFDKARQQEFEAQRLFNGHNPVFTAAVDKHPTREDALQQRFGPFQKLATDSQTALQTVERELQSGEPDYAYFGDSCTLIEENLNAMKTLDEQLRNQYTQLDRSFTRQLVDMRVDFFVIIGRTSWDNSSDFNTDREYIYAKRQVDEETYTAFDEWGDNAVASWSSGLFSSGTKTMVNKAYWDNLRINIRENWPVSRHDAAEFWIRDTPLEYYHKYQDEENGQIVVSDWMKVTDEVFEQYENDLGMDIYSKPYGVFEDEMVTEAVPPGYAYVGNEKYGRWETDSSGRRRWSFLETYAMYHLLFGGRNYYYYDNWNRWDRRSAYYGPASAPRSYGTYGSRSASWASNTAYGRSGGLNRPAPSVRGAGSAARGGGPASRGK